ncbi:hypothetical protein EK21DRAFT_63311 [Setomelanomma holmii]|uniref:Uncharacterized protein n=1 Tax=Setomelanomma holmii TaxID=210430 RepID=A0A9P4HB24_9PLEO|nr:hypothetical protein EK21DRAFT_63311 [Setomelanomma holmii]
MSAVYANGANGVNGAGKIFPPPRYSDVPSAITISVADEEGGQLDVEVALDEDIQDDPTELCAILENEKSLTSTWVQVAVAYAKQKKVDVAIDVLSQAIGVFGRARAEERLSILNGLCWLYLLKCREAPRVKSDANTDPDLKTKDHYLQLATGVLNDASRISPSHPPLFLARGVLYLLRASLQGPNTTAGPSTISSERAETLKQAAKCFDDALRASGGRNLMAKMGKARVSYSMGKWAEALKGYQNVLESSPDLTDPDPRIGIGCCFWQLGFKDDAASAWQRCLDLNPKSKIALILLGIYNLHLTSGHPPTDPAFTKYYKKATNEYVMPATKLDNTFPLTCATLGSYFIMRKDLTKAQTVARRAIDLTDVNAIASDGWYQLARKAHQEGDTAEASACYTKSDQARGGDERGYIPAKFGSAQMNVLMQNYDGAKFRLEKILQQQPTLEAQTLLGTLYAEDIFNAQNSRSTEDKSAELRKALKYLEDVQKAWRDPNKKVTPDQSVLLNLARLYEADHPEKSLKCLEEVEQMELDAIPEEDYPEEEEDVDIQAALREILPPQLLNNMGCFHFQADRYARARELFQTALKSCVKAASRDETIDTDALVTSISYNLGRCYESEGMLDEAKDVYENLLKRHADYVDARLRLTYITLRQHPNDQGPRAMKDLFKEYEDNTEVRALYGWFTNKSKRKNQPFATDEEQRLYKHTLQKSDKHDRYSLVGMGNILLTIAREMPRSSEQEKEKRRKGYERAVEFFEKVLQLDPKNAYAAQGIAIALVEDKKDFMTAIQIYNKVKETLKDHSVFVNLGHTFCEVKQYPRAIENNMDAWRTALDYSKQALKVAPTDLGYQFNVAFIQYQIAQNIMTVPEAQRSLAEVDEAAKGLTEAIESLDQIAKAEAPPFPRSDILSRANMGRNTMAKQLERAHDKQAAYEEQNASKLDQARKLREEELRKRDEDKRQSEEAARERRRKIIEEQERIAARDRELMEKRTEEERRRMEDDEDRELRKAERRARGPKQPKRKKKDADSDTDGLGSDSDAAEPRSRRRRTTASGTEGLSDEERPREKKKRKLARKSEPAGKYKSSEFVDDDSDDDAAPPADDGEQADGQLGSDEEGVAAPRARKGRVVDDEDEDEDEGIAAPASNGAVAMDEDEDE